MNVTGATDAARQTVPRMEHAITMTQQSVRSTRRSTARGQDGFGLVELLMATVVIAFVMVGFAMVFGGASRANANAGDRTGGTEVAASELAKVRSLDYAQIGTIGGNPPGVLQPVKTVGDFTVLTKVTYVDDPAPGGYGTKADFKRVRITVIVTQSGKTVATQETNFAPDGAPSQTKGVLKLTVIEAGTNLVIPDADVTLTGHPGATRRDTTDAAGVAIFPELQPNPSPAAPYGVEVSVAGYQVVPSDAPGTTNAQVRIAAATESVKTIRVARPVQMRFRIQDAATALPILPTITLHAVAANGLSSGTQAVTGGFYDGDTIGTMPLVPGETYVISASGRAGALWMMGRSVTFTVPLNPSPAQRNVAPVNVVWYANASIGALTVDVSESGRQVSGAIVRLTGGPASVNLVAVTDATGRVSFNAPLGTGYNVVVNHPATGGAATQTTSVTATRTITVSL